MQISRLFVTIQSFFKTCKTKLRLLKDTNIAFKKYPINFLYQKNLRSLIFVSNIILSYDIFQEFIYPLKNNNEF